MCPAGQDATLAASQEVRSRPVNIQESVNIVSLLAHDLGVGHRQSRISLDLHHEAVLVLILFRHCPSGAAKMQVPQIYEVELQAKGVLTDNELEGKGIKAGLQARLTAMSA